MKKQIILAFVLALIIGSARAATKGSLYNTDSVVTPTELASSNYVNSAQSTTIAQGVVTASDITDLGTTGATAGQVFMADGSGGGSWADASSPTNGITLETAQVLFIGTGDVGSAAYSNATAFASAEQGLLAEDAVQYPQRGVSASRPLNPEAGTKYQDTTLDKMLEYDGSAWKISDLADIPSPGNGVVMDFDSISNAVKLCVATAGQVTTNGPITYAGWFWRSESGDNRTFFSEYDTTVNKRKLSLDVGSAQLRLLYSTNGTSATIAYSSTTLPVGEWFHLAVCFRPYRSLKVYYDGVVKINITSNVPASLYCSDSPFGLGAYLGNSHGIMKARDIIVSNSALSDNEIIELYRSGTIPDRHLPFVRLNVPFDGSSQTIGYDESNYENHLFLSAFASNITDEAIADIPVYEPLAQADLLYYTNYNSSINRSLWDDVEALPEASGYMTRETIGHAVGTIPIERLTFTPNNYKKTVVVFGGVHGIEMTGSQVLPRFFNELMTRTNSDALSYLRSDIRFVVYPLVSPYALDHQSTYDGRMVPETDWIPCTWVRSGDQVTLTWPTTVGGGFPYSALGRLNPTNYISSANANKLYVSIGSSSDTSALPNSVIQGSETRYLVTAASGGFSATVTGNDSGSSSGTANLIVYVDPNRNFDDQFWSDFVPSPTFYDNKGTKPLSLSETFLIANDLIDNYSDAIALIDLHNGAGNGKVYTTTGNRSDIYNWMASYIVGYDGSISPELITLDAPTSVVFARYALGAEAINPEWGSALDETDNVMRWFGNFIVRYSKTVTNKVSNP